MTRGKRTACECDNSLGHQFQVSLSYRDHNKKKEIGLEPAQRLGELSSRGCEFGSQHPHGGSQLYEVPVSGDPVPSCVLHTHLVHVHVGHRYTCRQDTHTHELFLFLKRERERKERRERGKATVQAITEVPMTKS